MATPLTQTHPLLTGLLAELVWNFAADLKAPRWIRTPDGVRCIGEVAA